MNIALIPKVEELVLMDGYITQSTPCTSTIRNDLEEEAYELRISNEGIHLEGGSEKAIFYGEQTLNQILEQVGESIPCLFIKDNPAYSFRTFHIDCARHIIPIEELKKMIRTAAYFKFNYFHWHFSDDQGWRIESKAFPLLHEIGSVRKGDHLGDFSSQEEEGGYYTREQVRELVAYSQELGIEIIPEIGIPGHVSAMLAAYPELSCKGTQVEVATKAGIFWDILCPGKEYTFVFLEKLLDDMLELFPGKYIHLGGDEAPKERWTNCPCCQEYIGKNDLENEKQLQGLMINRVAEYLKTKNRKTIVWNEAADGGNLNPEIIIQLWTEDKYDKVKLHSEHGGKIILSNMMNSYCDYPYGFISLKSIYEIDIEPKGYKKTSILGNECLIWTEYIRSDEQLEKLAWPRFSAAAEVGWCGGNREGFDSYQNRLRDLLFIFEKMDIQVTAEEGWIPSEQETKYQLEEFQKNFNSADMEEFRRAQEAI